jgi:hypothetical protein
LRIQFGPNNLDATITVKNGQPDGGVQDLKANKGGDGHLPVNSDTADEVHIHGYDLHKEVEKDGTVTFDFPAKIDGGFVIELEDAKQTLANLEVEAMRRRHAATVAVGTLAAVAALPATASAHGLAGKQDLPIPRWLFAWAAALVLVISFAALAALWTRSRWETYTGTFARSVAHGTRTVASEA